ncbi:MAG TPA: hypothetical protein VGM89_08445 [Puia sp.]
MIRLYTLAAIFVGLLPTSVTAQQLASTASLISSHISHDKLSGMKARTQTLVQLVHTCLNTENGETPIPVWHGEYLAGKSSSGSLLRFGAQCSYYSVDNNADKKAELLLLANDLSPLLGHFMLNGNDYGTIRATITRRNGCLYFQLPRAEGADLDASFWLITADSSRLPYLPVSRREYLLEARQQLVGDTNAIATEWRSKLDIRSAAQQEAEKQSELRQLKVLYSGVDLEARTSIYLRSFTSDEVYLQRHIYRATSLHRNALRFVDSLLHTDPVELGRPAYLSPQIAEAAALATDPNAADPALAFHGFADNLPGALLLVRPNPSALNPYLGEDKPQFLLLGWRFDPTAPFAAFLDQQLHDNLDSRKIQDLLGK